ncbi:MAG TPA: glycerol-3-phosphate 1-O-acyltransferase PlsY [Gaiellaceae bacterium]
MRDSLLVTAGYLIGSIPWGYLLSRLLTGVDIRTVGSGNLGAANVWRLLGFKAGLAVALLDVGKGFAAALLGLWLSGELVGLLAGIAAMVGHWRPLFMGLGRGGKMVATTGGVALALAPIACIAASGVWIASFLVTRYTSVASMLSAAALPLFALALGSSLTVVAFAAGASIAILLLHRANIRRLLTGTENRFELRRRPDGLGRGTQRTF